MSCLIDLDHFLYQSSHHKNNNLCQIKNMIFSLLQPRECLLQALQNRTDGHPYIESKFGADPDYIYFVGSPKLPIISCTLLSFSDKYKNVIIAYTYARIQYSH